LTAFRSPAVSPSAPVLRSDLKNRVAKKLIPGRQTAFILSAALLIEGVVDRGVG
jgi:hypothetical protein